MTSTGGTERPIAFSPAFLAEQVVLVTGAAGSIGASVCALAAKAGARVIAAGRTLEKLEALAASLTKAGGRIEIRQVDVRDRASVDALFGSLDRLDIVIHSAGGQYPQAAIDFSPKGWRAVIETNLDGSFHIMQAAARHFRDSKTEGSIVNVVVSPRGLHHVAHTVAARAGVIAFSEAVAVEWAPLGIRVNCVAPGVIESEGWQTYQPRVRARYPNGNPLRRAGTPWDVAEACLYLAGPTGRFVTGTTLEVSGGGHLWGEVWTTDKPAWFLDASRALEPETSEP